MTTLINLKHLTLGYSESFALRGEFRLQVFPGQAQASDAHTLPQFWKYFVLYSMVVPGHLVGDGKCEKTLVSWLKARDKSLREKYCPVFAIRISFPVGFFEQD